MEKSELINNTHRTIVNLCTDDSRYVGGTERLRSSFSTQRNSQCSLTIFKGVDSCGAPRHQDNPYAFKLYAMKSAGLDFRSVLWLDSSVVLVRDTTPIWELLEEQGVFFEDSGHSVGQWCNDRVLSNFGITREEAHAMPMFSAGFSGVNFQHEIGKEFFIRWWESMERGDFKGDWSDHRHDMTCGSIIANQMGLKNLYTSGGMFFPYIGSGYSEPKETAVGHLLGV